jgi:hypothetical protein
MRFLVLVKATPSTEAAGRPSPELAAEMAKYKDEMTRAGVLVDFSGLQPSSQGARVRLSAARPMVIDGPNPRRIEAELEVRQLSG